MALVSPGVQVTVTDQSNYAPNALGSVAYILLATAQDKAAPGGTSIAAGTTTDNAGKLYNITSQRDLVTTFGTPTFYTTASGAPINGGERNEYGLLAAYSLLGVSNTVYVQRADVDLGALEGSTSRPLANPAGGSYWLDTASTNWGMYEWNATTQTFTLKTPTPIFSAENLADDQYTPNVSIGGIGDYAINVLDDTNPVFYKRYDNTWQLVGNIGWEHSWSAVTGNISNPVITLSSNIVINGTTIGLPSVCNVSTANTTINAASITGVSTAVNGSGQLVLIVDRTAKSNGSTTDGRANIANGTNDPLTSLGIAEGSYASPAVSITPYYTVPDWQASSDIPRPTGSLWQKSSVVGTGLSVALKKFNATTESWDSQAVADYSSVTSATFGFDPTGGGLNISADSLFAQYNSNNNGTVSTYFWVRKNTGPTIAVGESTTPVAANVGAKFTLTTRNSATSGVTSAHIVTIGAATVQGFINAVSAANIPNVTAALADTGAMTLVHALGGDMILTDGTGTPLANIGITASGTNVYADPAGTSSLIATNWQPLSVTTYTPAASQPYVAPENDKLWYYNTPSRADIMISNGSAWVGYQTLSSDIRGYNLTTTNAAGPILRSTKPTAQDDGTELVFGDLWIDTSDLENYPMIYRWQRVNGVDQWVAVNKTDRSSQNGIIFADARWATSGSVDPVTGAIPTIAQLAKSNYVDLDAPDPALYPRGMLLFNTRASGYNVKQYKSAYFTSSAYPNESLPAKQSTWVSVSGFDSFGTPVFGRKAPRSVVVAALKSAIDSSTALREEQNVFNLLACPGYPELIPNMVSLNNDRDNTGFIVGDTPVGLPANGTEIQSWAQNSNGVTATNESGLATINPYVGVYYPSGQTNDLSGNAVVVPPSHAVLRAIVKSDNISYPWLAPAGTRRGLIDNLNAIGYVDQTSGAFISVGVTQGLRDVLYTNKINPLTYLPGTGLVVYGQKTLSSTPSSLDRVNVARLVNYLRTQLNTLARPFIFEPNDPITRNAITSIVSSLMNDLVSKRGITDYLVVCDASNNTPERIARNELYVDVAVQPTKDVEFIYIPIRLKNPGEIQAGNLASATAVGTGA
jgi:hypothetical protein